MADVIDKPGMAVALQCWPVTTGAQAEVVRQLRNSCREFMTRYTGNISEEQQQEWWAKRPEDLQLHLFRVGATNVGYGLIRSMDDGGERRPWLSGGLAPEWRGMGFGSQLFAKLVDVAGRPCMLEVRQLNNPAKRIYEKLGFREVRTEHGIVTMELV